MASVVTSNERTESAISSQYNYIYQWCRPAPLSLHTILLSKWQTLGELRQLVTSRHKFLYMYTGNIDKMAAVNIEPVASL